ncbi:DUF6691 family protein [Planctomycetota bacterium]
MDNPIVGLIMGSIFGACIVLAGFADPDKIIGSLRLKDFHVLRTMIVFIVVGMLGTWALEQIGTANLNIKPAMILAVLIGGVIFGAGFGLSGYFPGTALAGAASGRIDALATILGMFLGSHAYFLLYPSLIMPVENIAYFGKVTLPQVTNITRTFLVISVFAISSLALFLTIPRRGGKNKKSNKVGDLKMDEVLSDPISPIPIPRTKEMGFYLKTDCFEAAQVFCGWKNVFFLILVLCLIVLQTIFWIASDRYIQINKNNNPERAVVFSRNTDSSKQAAIPDQQGTNLSSPANTEYQAREIWYREIMGIDITISFELIETIMNIVSILLVSISVVYTLTLYFAMAASFIGKLGGLGHISSAFFLSLVVLILLIPWQIFFGSTISGSIYTLDELEGWFIYNNSDILNTSLIYLRFTGYWALIVILLVSSHFYSRRWTKSIRLRYQQIL